MTWKETRHDINVFNTKQNILKQNFNVFTIYENLFQNIMEVLPTIYKDLLSFIWHKTCAKYLCKINKCYTKL